MQEHRIESNQLVLANPRKYSRGYYQCFVDNSEGEYHPRILTLSEILKAIDLKSECRYWIFPNRIVKPKFRDTIWRRWSERQNQNAKADEIITRITVRSIIIDPTQISRGKMLFLRDWWFVWDRVLVEVKANFITQVYLSSWIHWPPGRFEPIIQVGDRFIIYDVIIHDITPNI